MYARGERAEEVEEDAKTGGDEQRMCPTCYLSHSLYLTESMCDSPLSHPLIPSLPQPLSPTLILPPSHILPLSHILPPSHILPHILTSSLTHSLIPSLPHT